MTVYLAQTLHCIGKFILYIIPCVIVLLTVYRFCSVPKYIFRKLLHIVAFTCVTLMILVAKSWIAASLASVTVMVVIYPVLTILEKYSWYAKLFAQKSPGEIKRSLVMLFGMFAVLTAIGWGIFHRPGIVAAAILMWGTGDAAAALVGIPLGKHKVSFADGKKSWEGTAAMFFAAFVSGFIIFYFYEKLTVTSVLSVVFPGALIGAATELLTPSEYDTISVPTAILAVLLIIGL